MKKTLLALTLATLPVAALAEVQVYGKISAGVEAVKTKVEVSPDAAGGSTPTITQITDFGSRIGFKGKEDLGSGLSAIWQLEQSAAVSGSQQGWASRDSFIGLEGSFGQVRAGLLSSPIKSADELDQWAYSNDALGLAKFTQGTAVNKRNAAIRYDSPEVSGLSGSLYFSPRDNNNPADLVHKELSHAEYGLGLNYKHDSGVFAKYAAGVKANNYVVADAHKAGQQHLVEVGYDANNLFVGVGYQYSKGVNGAATSNKEVALSAAYTAGNVTPKLSYARSFGGKDLVTGAKIKNKYDQVVLGADYAFSKRTVANVQAGWLREKGYSETGVAKVTTKALGVGLTHKF